MAGWILSITHAGAFAQTRKDFFRPGEELVYNVSYGFISLGTVVIQTGAILPDHRIKAHLEFWSAHIPFLHVRTNITDQFSLRDLTLRIYEEHTQYGHDSVNKYAVYNPTTRTLVYSDDKVTDKVSHDMDPYDDALGIFFNMRAWSDAVGHRYLFHVIPVDGPKPVTLTFTNQTVQESVPAFGDKKIPARVIQGWMDMDHSAPLGADGAFTAYVSEDDAAIPLRIDMSIAIGSVSLTLEKVRRSE